MNAPARIAAACLAAIALACALCGIVATAPAHAAVALTVTSTGDEPDADAGDGICADAQNACTLRAAIEELNADDEGGAIAFALPDPAGVNVIAPQAPLPPITRKAEIDGFTQARAAMPTESAPADLRVELRGADTGTGPVLPYVHGLVLAAGSDDSVVRGLAIGGFRGYGVQVASDRAWIAGNHLGLGADGKTLPNRAGGVGISGATETCVGGDAAEDRNVISGNWRNAGTGIVDEGGTSTIVSRNFIGPDPSGAARPVDAVGDRLSNQTGVRLDGATGGELHDNVISGNATNGIELDGGADHLLHGNVVGLTPSTEAKLPNGLIGVRIVGSANALIGGSAEAERNVVGGNGSTGILILGAGSDGAQVLGNRIGVDRTGTKGDDGAERWLGNDGIGILVGSAPNVTIGAAGAGNVVGMNGYAEQQDRKLAAGITISGAGATGAVLQGNMVGVDAAGSGDHVLGNLGASVRIDGAPGVVVGGTAAGEGNVIALAGLGLARCCKQNTLGGPGIHLTGGADASGAVLEGNRIGTDGTGTIALGGAGHGVQIDTGVADTRVGGAGPGAGNVIVTTTPGVPGGSSLGVATDGPRTTIAGNRIGTDVTGTKVLGNERCGVALGAGADGSVVGGATAAHGNVIGGSGVDGIESTPADVTIRHNRIGIGADGTTAVPNKGSGIVAGGDRLVVADNVLSGNGYHGVAVIDGDGVRISGNRIGTNTAGDAKVPNSGYGVWLVPGADVDGPGPTDPVVGGASPEDANVIAGNGDAGVVLEAEGAELTGNRVGAGPGDEPLGNGGSGVIVRKSNIGIEANTIRFNRYDGVAVRSDQAGNRIVRNAIDDNGELGIDLQAGDPGAPVLGVTENDAGDADAGANNLQNFPVVERAVADPATGATAIGFRLSSLPEATFRVDVYASPKADASGHGEARTWLGAVDVTTDAAGEVTGTLTVDEIVSGVVTATATTEYGDTSELSLARAVSPPRIDEPVLIGDPGPDRPTEKVTPPGTTPAPAAPAPAPAATGPAPMTRGQVVTALLSGMKISGTRGTLASILSTGGYPASFVAPGPGGVRIDWRAPVGRGAAGRGRRTGSVLVARGKAAFARGGAVKVEIRLTKAGRALLRRTRGRAAITVYSKFSGPGVKVESRRTVKLRRR